MYTAFASVYDRLMQDVDYDAWAAHYARLLSAAGVKTGRVCECACGTGSLTVRLRRLGYQMTGVDLSQEMLSIAAQKARDGGLTIPFVRQDMCRLALHRRQDAVLCTCDGMNYLTTPDRARKFLSAAYAALRPGGVLAMDLSTPHKLKNTLGCNVLGCQDEDISYVWQNSYQARTRTVDMRLSIFVRQPSGDYARFEETQTQRAHTREELTKYLENTGITAIRFYGETAIGRVEVRVEREHAVDCGGGVKTDGHIPAEAQCVIRNADR